MSSEKKLNSEQTFKLDIDYCISLLKLISEGKTSKEELQEAKAIGPNKINTFGFWMRIIDLVDYNNGEFELTQFGSSILEIRYSYDYVASLLFYKLSRGWDNGGHFYFSKLINDILYNKAFSLDNIISKAEVKKKIANYSFETEVDEERMKEFAIQNMNTLSDPDMGFGKLGMVIKQNNEYEVYSYWPEPIVCAYIIYDRWQDGMVAMKIEDIIKGHYNFGRIFYLDKETVMGILETLRQDGYISIETVAGLNQIRVNPDISKNDILKEIEQHV
ncbi:MAG: DUF4007 family protein [Bacillota bacterium]